MSRTQTPPRGRNSGLGDRGVSREFQMGAENPGRGKSVVRGPEVGMIMAIKGLTDQHAGQPGSWGTYRALRLDQEAYS